LEKKHYKECFSLPFENADLLLKTTKKNRLIFPNRCEKSTCFFLPLEDQKLLLRKRRISIVARKLLSAIMYFFATSRTED
jgi:hypothetical protein